MKIKAIITGATGMVGMGVLLECLENESVESILVIGRQSVNIKHPKLKEIIHKDFFDLKAVQDQLSGYNACFFSLGVTSFRMPEDKYKHLTYDLTINFAETLIEVSKDLIFCYVSGAGTDSSENGNPMWARIKGQTENAILAMPFSKSYMFRPGMIYPEKGVKSKTLIYNIFMPVLKILYPVLKRIIPNYVTTTTAVAKAMINVVLEDYELKHLESTDINNLAGQ